MIARRSASFVIARGDPIAHRLLVRRRDRSLVLASFCALRHATAMVPESPLESTEHGLVPNGSGWFVLNAREAPWRSGDGRGAFCGFEGEPDFPQVGVNLVTLAPGEPMSMYHWEAD